MKVVYDETGKDKIARTIESNPGDLIQNFSYREDLEMAAPTKPMARKPGQEE